ncbi:putative protein N(5)-glutamine methyltransferase [Nocardioides mesophilus]|uniref:peptide chain release factor N(5)-glutamine methyltransferase n=1 Tax=Nocardioides mesophilus TaxID=433659 RepID=A0A7G9RGP5_9ACTN|nr:putative protein N(5)-glutamine methyltransferase [Nocardioides mesophilus]
MVATLRAAGCVFAEEEAALLVEAATTPEQLDRLVRERVGGVPLEHLLGWAAFHGLRIEVDRGVFVPRRRTELLVAETLTCLDDRARPVVVDLCCGAGAIAAAIAACAPDVEVHAAELDPKAVTCARRNVEPRGGTVHEGDLYAALPTGLAGRVDVLVANAPYVPTGSIAMMPPEARLHEHPVALDGGTDGLDVQRRVVAGAGAWLAPGGRLLIESSRRQAGQLAEEMRAHGLEARIVSDEELNATAVVGALTG